MINNTPLHHLERELSKTMVTSTLATPVTSAPVRASTPPPIVTNAKPATTLSGADQLSDADVNIIHKTHDEMIKSIDNVIVRLQNLKSQVQVRRDSAEAEIRTFISTVGKALEHVDALEEAITDIE